MTRLEALEAVAAAARRFRSPGWINNPLWGALDALDALPASPAATETVEVRAGVWRDPSTSALMVYGVLPKFHTDWNTGSAYHPLIATITARIPLPIVPEIAATVEGGGR